MEMAIVGGANLKLLGTHIGVTLTSDGPSQMALPDIRSEPTFPFSTLLRTNLIWADIKSFEKEPLAIATTSCNGASWMAPT
jgi:hypothetical protein